MTGFVGRAEPVAESDRSAVVLGGGVSRYECQFQ